MLLLYVFLYAAALESVNNQHDLDHLATRIDQQAPYHDLKQLARQQFLSTVEAFGYTADSDYMQDQLQVAVQELAFGFLQQAVNSDPARPKVYRIVAPPLSRERSGMTVPGGRFGFDNPDCIYRIIPVSSSYRYVIHGKGTGPPASDITISLHSSFTGSTIALLGGKDIIRDEQGCFEISVSSDNTSSLPSPAPNHIQTTPESKLLLIRHNIGDWLVETADELSIKVTSKADDVSADDQGLSNEAIIQEARATLQKNIFVANFLLGKVTLSAPVNTMMPPTQSTKMGLATQALVLSHYRLQKQDALVVTIEAGPSTYWSLGVHSLWMVTEDARNRLVTLNNNQAIRNRNGSYTFVLAAADPNIFNWLNTSSHGAGTIIARFQGLPLDGGALSKIHIWTHLSTLHDLHLVLPDDIMYLSAPQRACQMATRAIGYDRIYSFDSLLPDPRLANGKSTAGVSANTLPSQWFSSHPYCSAGSSYQGYFDCQE